MCGIVGIASPIGTRPSADAREIARLRDLLAHRGPDGLGILDLGNVILAHRRLAVIDPSPAGAQPFVEPRHAPGHALVYNGELYNEPDLRATLLRSAPFSTQSDTETLLRVLAEASPRGPAAAGPRLRGMYAFAHHDAHRHTLTLARDPLGVKPLYWTRVTIAGVPEIAFASEPSALAAYLDGTHAESSAARAGRGGARPDLAVVSAYLSTIRTTLDDRTLFAGVRALRPGEWITIDLASPDLRMRHESPPWPTYETRPSVEPAPVSVRRAIGDSLRRHLRSDVPVCCLLSGGLDSTITATLAQRHVPRLRTYCAGAAPAPGEPRGDFAFAREVASGLGVDHTSVELDAARFTALWRSMVERLSVPLSTPNETAIFAVASALRARGDVVAVSGEGADELFAGYDLPLRAVLAARREGRADLARALLDSASWTPVAKKPALLTPDAWREAEADAPLIGFFEREFAQALAPGHGPSGTDTGLAAAQRVIRRVNLEGLLLRLDTSMMLAGVEGRTPFADAVVAGLAESLPMSERFDADLPDGVPGTKLVLRRAFSDIVPPGVLARPKASFPLPFQAWCAASAGVLAEPGPLRDWVRPDALARARLDPAANWTLAWPLINLALWARRWG